MTNLIKEIVGCSEKEANELLKLSKKELAFVIASKEIIKNLNRYHVPLVEQ